MQFGGSDNLHNHQPQEILHHTPKAAHFLSRWERRLFGNPLMFVLLVWGVLFLILSVTLAFAQDASHVVNQRHTAINPCAATDRTDSDKKTETVEIFSAGQDMVIPPRAPAVKVPPRRRAGAFHQRAQR